MGQLRTHPAESDAQHGCRLEVPGLRGHLQSTPHILRAAVDANDSIGQVYIYIYIHIYRHTHIYIYVHVGMYICIRDGLGIVCREY